MSTFKAVLATADKDKAKRTLNGYLKNLGVDSENILLQKDWTFEVTDKNQRKKLQKEISNSGTNQIRSKNGSVMIIGLSEPKKSFWKFW